MHPHRFPNEPDAYRAARDELLAAELDLRRRTEAVAAMRRDLPLGGETPTDYIFEEGPADLADRETVRSVWLGELFDGADTLVLYSLMFGAEAETPCPMCASFLDGLNGNATQIRQRVAMAVVAKAPIRRIRDLARNRGWHGLRLVSSAGNTYNRDYFGEDESGSQNPMMTVFVRRSGRFHHFWSSELQFLPGDAGQNQRHLDTMWPLWNVLDLGPAGRGDWYPKL
jgi:predicted dithiol-disulfide oxidoreductase (DUF899 family)